MSLLTSSHQYDMECRAALLLQRLPGRTENFIFREILELNQRLQDFVVVSIQSGNPLDWEVLDRGESLRCISHKLLEQVLHRMLCIHAKWLLRHPVRYGLTVVQALRLHHGPSPKAVKQFFLAVLLAETANQNASNHLHAAFANHLANIVHLASQLLGIPYTVSAHAHDLWAQRPLVPVLNEARCCIACTRAGQNYLNQEFPLAKTVLVRHGVKIPGPILAGMKPIPPWSPGSVLHLISAGRFVAKKGFDTLIDACRILREQGIAVECDIYGDGALRESLERQIIDTALTEIVRLPGFISHRDLVAQLRGAHLCVLPCRIDPATRDRDGVPNVMLEAMACGTLVIGGAIPSVCELIENGVSGYVTPPNQPRELAGLIMRILHQPDGWNRIRGQALAKLADEYDPERNIMTLISLMNNF